jgi:hypothetical protein
MDREVMANMPDIIIKNKKREVMCTDRCGNTSKQGCDITGSRKENKIQEFMYKSTTNVECEMYDCTSNNWSHQNDEERFKEKFGRHAIDSLQKTAVLGTSHGKYCSLKLEA